MGKNSTFVEVEGKITAVSDKAILLDSETWILISQIHDDGVHDTPPFEKGDEISIVIPEWLAIDKGLF